MTSAYRPLRHALGRGPTLFLLILLAVAACDEPTTPSPTHGALVTTAPAGLDGQDVTAWLDFEMDGTQPVVGLMLEGMAAHDRMLELMDDAHEGGTSGFYLRQLGGPTHLAQNEGVVFEPASTIKALVHFHAMRQVQDGAVVDGDVVTLGRQIENAWATMGGSSCPQPATPFTASLETGLTAMMVPSDNPWTQALRDFFGDGPIDATRQTFGMDDSVLQHRIGCGADALANPNQLTLEDGGKMYEAVATGFLTGAARDAAYAIMLTDAGLFNTMIDDEAVGLALSDAAINAFKAGRRSALKAGSYGLAGLSYRSVAGWAELPFKDAACQIDPQEYVYGAFIHAADTLTGAGIRALGVETFREQVREGLETWAACEADLRIFSPQAIDLGAPLHVNEPVAFTVRHTVVNDGPAPAVDALLTTTITAPADCEVVPAHDVRPVPGLGAASVQVDVPVTLTCSQPSNHLFQITGEIESQDPAITDPDPSNNSSTTPVVRAFIAYADLAITGWDFTELDDPGLADFVVGQAFLFSTTKSVQNLGDTELGLYHDPADVRVSRTMIVPEGIRGQVRIGPDEAPAQVVIQREGQPDQLHDDLPAGAVVQAEGAATLILRFGLQALAVDEERTLQEEFGIECLGPGALDLSFINEIEAVDPHLLDPDPDNNTLAVERTVECRVPVQPNIRPGNAHNQVNPGSHQSVPVAILTIEAGEYGLPLAFDATAIDPATVRFGTLHALGSGGGGLATQSFIRDSFEMDDQTKDGDADMVLHFPMPGTGADSGTEALCVAGQFLGEGGVWYGFLGCDVVTPVGP
jgi:hypothetical protein